MSPAPLNMPVSNPTLERFVAAQDACFDAFMAELKAGQKVSHWMWFVFPQLRDLGRSRTAIYYGIADLNEAKQFLSHNVLGPRLKQCVGLLLAQPYRDPHAIFGSPDDMKFRSCLTLFACAAPDEPLFSLALKVFFQGQPDDLTLALVS